MLGLYTGMLVTTKQDIFGVTSGQFHATFVSTELGNPKHDRFLAYAKWFCALPNKTIGTELS